MSSFKVKVRADSPEHHGFKLNPDFKPVALGDTALFEPIKLGNIELQHRVVLAPLSRLKSEGKHVPSDMMIPYYDQRSKKAGTFVISEATCISDEAGGYDMGPGIYTQKQVEQWSKVFHSIHENNSFVFQQLWALGRQSFPEALKEAGRPFVGPSKIYPDEVTERTAIEAGNELHALTKPEIEQYVRDYVSAARNSIIAGADGIELNSGNGYLLNQFLDNDSNVRIDEYGGSIENRARFVLQVVDAVSREVGAAKVGIRLTPFGKFGSMSGVDNPLTIAQYAYLYGELERRAKENESNRLAYIHIVQPRVTDFTVDEFQKASPVSGDFIYSIWNGNVIKTGNYALDPESTRKEIEFGKTLISYGRYFISNPDLPDRLALGKPLTKYVRELFYTPGIHGYSDYPTYREQKL